MKEGDTVFVPDHMHSLGWVPQTGTFKYTDEYGRLCVEVYSPFDRNPPSNRCVYFNQNQVYSTAEECKEFIRGYFYHGFCEKCKYDKYSSVHTCGKCIHRAGHCNIIKEKTGLEIYTSEICENYEPKTNKGEWIDFNWYMEVMKKCWCNVGSENCPAQNTICRTCSFKHQQNLIVHITFRMNQPDYVFNSYVRWEDYISLRFIKDGKIWVDTAEILTTKNKKQKRDIARYLGKDDINKF